MLLFVGFVACIHDGCSFIFPVVCAFLVIVIIYQNMSDSCVSALVRFLPYYAKKAVKKGGCRRWLLGCLRSVIICDISDDFVHSIWIFSGFLFASDPQNVLNYFDLLFFYYSANYLIFVYACGCVLRTLWLCSVEVIRRANLCACMIFS